MSHDIRTILQRLTAVEEGRLSPVSQKKGLTAQQDRVPQLPALFKPKKISVLATASDPQHPMKGYAVGANESKLAETMAEIEEDMVSRVKNDLRHYLDQLDHKSPVDDGRRDPDSTPTLDSITKKEKRYRDMLQQAVKAIQSAEEVEEELDENDYEITEPETVNDVHSTVDAALSQPQQPVKVMEIADGIEFAIHETNGQYEVRHQDVPINSRFRTANEAEIAVKLFQDHYRRQRRNSTDDYIEEN